MSDEAPAVRVISLGRPLAGAVVDGPCGVLNLSAIDFVLPAEGLLLAIHANGKWTAADAAAVRDRGLWPECPLEASGHAEGLVGCGLVASVAWLPDGESDDPWAAGPWVLTLKDRLRFRTPTPMVAYAGVRELPALLSDRIAAAWLNRPL